MTTLGIIEYDLVAAKRLINYVSWKLSVTANSQFFLLKQMFSVC